MPRLHILKGFSDLDGALWVLKYHPGLRTRPEIISTILANGFTVTDRVRFDILQLLEEWELADTKKRWLTPQGKEFYSLWEMKRETAIDVLHGLQYGLWTQHASTQNLASWAYQRVCDYLWDYRKLPKTQDLISYLYDSREALDERQGDIADAFSTKSVNSGYDWLLSLSPPVLQGVSATPSGRRNFKNATFARRSYCSPALFVMGLSWVMREAGNEFGNLVAIDDNRKLQVCYFCLLEESQFDFMLNETLHRFAFLSVQQIGRLFVVIKQEPKIDDF
jgi:hypothetical protein